MLQLETQVNQMLPLIDTELERVDRKHAQLTQLSSDLVEAINLYHTLMREPDRSISGYMNYPSSMQQQQMRGGLPPTSGIYQLPNMNQMYQFPPHLPPNSMQAMHQLPSLGK